MTVYVVYTQFTDDPSEVYGIYSTFELAKKSIEGKTYFGLIPIIAEFELNETLEEPISLN